MSAEMSNPNLLDDEEFEALEAMLISDVVPEDCMDLEMLDGYLAAVIASPQPIPPERWLPGVWSAHGEEVSFGSGSQMQRAIRLVRRYYNEILTTLGEPEGWEPFCYAAGEGDTLAIGEEWIEGFAQGLELWPAAWEKAVPEAAANDVRDALEAMLAPWSDEKAKEAGEATRLQWLEAAMAGLGDIVACWQRHDVPRAAPLSIDEPAVPARAEAGRNEACPCGSGKKYKKCCGAPT